MTAMRSQSRAGTQSKVVVGLLGAVVVGGWALWRAQSNNSGGAPESFDAAPADATRTPSERRLGVSSPAAPASSIQSDQVTQFAKAQREREEPMARLTTSRERADELRRVLRKLWADRAAANPEQSTGAPSRMPASDGKGNQADKPLGKYIRSVVEEQFTPLAKDCYAELLERVPNIAGNLVLEMNISGALSVGGVVENVSVADGATLKDSTFLTCMQESMYSLVLDAPPEDNESITVKYPISVSPEGDEGQGQDQGEDEG
jgi:hypothetical protein